MIGGLITILAILLAVAGVAWWLTLPRRSRVVVVLGVAGEVCIFAPRLVLCVAGAAVVLVLAAVAVSPRSPIRGVRAWWARRLGGAS